jgi:hypothetical protein
VVAWGAAEGEVVQLAEGGARLFESRWNRCSGSVRRVDTACAGNWSGGIKDDSSVEAAFVPAPDPTALVLGEWRLARETPRRGEEDASRVVALSGGNMEESEDGMVVMATVESCDGGEMGGRGGGCAGIVFCVRACGKRGGDAAAAFAATTL